MPSERYWAARQNYLSTRWTAGSSSGSTGPATLSPAQEAALNKVAPLEAGQTTQDNRLSTLESAGAAQAATNAAQTVKDTSQDGLIATIQGDATSEKSKVTALQASQAAQDTLIASKAAQTEVDGLTASQTAQDALIGTKAAQTELDAEKVKIVDLQTEVGRIAINWTVGTNTLDWVLPDGSTGNAPITAGTAGNPIKSLAIDDATDELVFTFNDDTEGRVNILALLDEKIITSASADSPTSTITLTRSNFSTAVLNLTGWLLGHPKAEDNLADDDISSQSPIVKWWSGLALWNHLMTWFGAIRGVKMTEPNDILDVGSITFEYKDGVTEAYRSKSAHSRGANPPSLDPGNFDKNPLAGETQGKIDPTALGGLMPVPARARDVWLLDGTGAATVDGIPLPQKGLLVALVNNPATGPANPAEWDVTRFQEAQFVALSGGTIDYPVGYGLTPRGGMIYYGRAGGGIVQVDQPDTFVRTLITIDGKTETPVATTGVGTNVQLAIAEGDLWLVSSGSNSYQFLAKKLSGSGSGAMRYLAIRDEPVVGTAEGAEWRGAGSVVTSDPTLQDGDTATDATAGFQGQSFQFVRAIFSGEEFDKVQISARNISWPVPIKMTISERLLSQDPWVAASTVADILPNFSAVNSTWEYALPFKVAGQIRVELETGVGSPTGFVRIQEISASGTTRIARTVYTTDGTDYFLDPALTTSTDVTGEEIVDALVSEPQQGYWKEEPGVDVARYSPADHFIPARPTAEQLTDENSSPDTVQSWAPEDIRAISPSVIDSPRQLTLYPDVSASPPALTQLDKTFDILGGQVRRISFAPTADAEFYESTLPDTGWLELRLKITPPAVPFTVQFVTDQGLVSKDIETDGSVTDNATAPSVLGAGVEVFERDTEWEIVVDRRGLDMTGVTFRVWANRVGASEGQWSGDLAFDILRGSVTPEAASFNTLTGNGNSRPVPGKLLNGKQVWCTDVMRSITQGTGFGNILLSHTTYDIDQYYGSWEGTFSDHGTGDHVGVGAYRDGSSYAVNQRLGRNTNIELRDSAGPSSRIYNLVVFYTKKGNGGPIYPIFSGHPATEEETLLDVGTEDATIASSQVVTKSLATLFADGYRYLWMEIWQDDGTGTRRQTAGPYSIEDKSSGELDRYWGGVDDSDRWMVTFSTQTTTTITVGGTGRNVNRARIWASRNIPTPTTVKAHHQLTVQARGGNGPLFGPGYVPLTGTNLVSEVEGDTFTIDGDTIVCMPGFRLDLQGFLDASSGKAGMFWVLEGQTTPFDPVGGFAQSAYTADPSDGSAQWAGNNASARLLWTPTTVTRLQLYYNIAAGIWQPGYGGVICRVDNPIAGTGGGAGTGTGDVTSVQLAAAITASETATAYDDNRDLDPIDVYDDPRLSTNPAGRVSTKAMSDILVGHMPIRVWDSTYEWYSMDDGEFGSIVLDMADKKFYQCIIDNVNGGEAPSATPLHWQEVTLAGSGGTGGGGGGPVVELVPSGHTLNLPQIQADTVIRLLVPTVIWDDTLTIVPFAGDALVIDYDATAYTTGPLQAVHLIPDFASKTWRIA